MSELTRDQAGEIWRRNFNVRDVPLGTIAAIQEAFRLGQSQAIPQWIACSERMPESQVWVQSWREGEKSTSFAYWFEAPEGEVEWVGPFGHTTTTSHAYLPPTHWCERAAAPAPQGENHGRD